MIATTVAPAAPAPPSAKGSSPAETGGGAIAYYTYAIARPKRAAQHAPLDIAGVDPRARVYTLAHGDLLAVVSAVPLADFEPEALRQRLADHDWLRGRALAHQAVQAALLEDYTAVPLKFCTLYKSERRVAEMLESDGDTLRATLDRLDGATEWGVKMFCDRDQLVEWASSSSDELQPLRASLGRMSAGAGYMLRKKIALTAQQLAESLQHSYAQASHLRLSAVARAAASHPAQSADVHGQADEMVLNGAYLIDDCGMVRFEAELAQMQAQYTALGFRCELTGPWPPYSFAAAEEGA